jgi:hypothetical protein
MALKCEGSTLTAECGLKMRVKKKLREKNLKKCHKAAPINGTQNILPH